MRDSFLENFAYFMIKMAKFFVKLAIFCVVIYLLGMKLFAFGHRLFYEKAMDSEEGKEIVFEIKNDDTIDTVATNLKNAGLIDDPLVFKFRAKIYKTNLTPNVYNLKTTMTPKNILDIFDSPSEENLAVIAKPDESVYELAPEGEEDVEAEIEKAERISNN